jgi:hypothetical protein
MGGLAQIELLGQPSNTEFVWVENVSAHGVRVMSRRRWLPGDRLVISSRYQAFSSVVARVVYCQPQLAGLFAVGCEFGETSVAALLAKKRA